MKKSAWNLLLLAPAGYLLALAGCTRPPVIGVGPAVVAAAEDAPPKEPGKAGDAGAEASPAPAAAPDVFRFPDDTGGKLLAKLLPPADRGMPAAPSVGQRQFPPKPAVEQPAPPLPSGPDAVVRLPGEKPRPLQPSSLREDVPLLNYRGTPPPPESQAMAVGGLVRTASPKMNQPPSLPPLAQPVVDRALLDDPTTDASLAAALAAPLPARANAAPFLKLTLPDPFENRQTVRLRQTPAEDPTPAAAPPKPPK